MSAEKEESEEKSVIKEGSSGVVLLEILEVGLEALEAAEERYEGEPYLSESGEKVDAVGAVKRAISKVEKELDE